MNDDLRAGSTGEMPTTKGGEPSSDRWLSEALRVLKSWSEIVPPGPAAISLKDAADIIDFQARFDIEEERLDHTERIASDFVDRMNELRSIAWRVEIARKPSLGEWKPDDFGRPIFEVDPRCVEENRSIRRRKPLGLREAIELLRSDRSVAGAKPPLASIAVAMAHALWGAGSRIGDKTRGFIEPGAQFLEETWGNIFHGILETTEPDDRAPTPAVLARSLEALFHSEAPAVARGHLSGDAWTRLFLQFPLLFDEVPSGLFESARESAEWLRDRFEPATSTAIADRSKGPSLKDTYDRIIHLGDLADELTPYFRERPQFREWAYQLLANLRRLGRLARVLKDTEIVGTGEVTPPEGPDGGEPPPPPPPPPVPHDIPGHEEMNALAADAVALAGELGNANWSHAFVVVSKVRECSRSLERFIKEAAADLEDPSRREAALIRIGRRQSDAMLDTLVGLDTLLPGVGERGPVPAERAGPDELTAKVKQLRDRLFGYLDRHGGYRMLPVAPREPFNRPEMLEMAGTMPGSQLAYNSISCVVRPGYYWERDGEKRTVQKARVKIA